MPDLLAGLSPGAHVAVIRLRSLGDCVLTTPALQLLKGARPDLQIGVVVEPRFGGVFSGNLDVSCSLAPSLSALRRWAPELCLNLHGGTRSAVLSATSGAKWRAGFQHFRHSALYNVRLPRAQEIFGVERVVHTAEHLASAVFHLGVPIQPVPAARLFAQIEARHSPYAVLHPFASQPAKVWPPARFLQAAEMLDKGGLSPMFVGGATDDLSPFSKFEVHAGSSLESLKSLLAGAALFLGNDSGPAHMAAAFQVPSVVLFGASDPTVWAPWKTAAEQLVASDGIASISVDAVLEAVERLRVAA